MKYIFDECLNFLFLTLFARTHECSTPKLQSSSSRFVVSSLPITYILSIITCSSRRKLRSYEVKNQKVFSKISRHSAKLVRELWKLAEESIKHAARLQNCPSKACRRGWSYIKQVVENLSKNEASTSLSDFRIVIFCCKLFIIIFFTLIQAVLYSRRALESCEFEDRQKSNNSCTFRYFQAITKTLPTEQKSKNFKSHTLVQMAKCLKNTWCKKTNQ